MDQKCNKQFWLENALKKLYKRMQTLNAKVKKKNRKRKRIFLPPTPCTPKREPPKQYDQENSFEKEFQSERKKFWDFVDEFLLSRTAYAQSKKYFIKLRKKPSSVNYVVWKSIKNSLTLPSTLICRSPAKQIVPQDAEEGSSIALRSRTVHRESDNPTTTKKIVKRKQGNSINLRSRVIRRPSDHRQKSSEKGVVKKKADPVEQERALALKIFLKIQQARIRKATDVISKEFVKEQKSRKKNKSSRNLF